MGPLPNGLVLAYKLGVILSTYKSWDDPKQGHMFRFQVSFGKVTQVGNEKGPLVV